MLNVGYVSVNLRYESVNFEANLAGMGSKVWRLPAAWCAAAQAAPPCGPQTFFRAINRWMQCRQRASHVQGCVASNLQKQSRSNQSSADGRGDCLQLGVLPL